MEETKEYDVHFTIKASIHVSSSTEGKALKRFWEKEVDSLIKAMNANTKINKENVTIEAKEILAKEENEQKKKIFISR